MLFSVTTGDALKDLYLLIGEDKTVAVTGNRDLIVLEEEMGLKEDLGGLVGPDLGRGPFLFVSRIRLR